MNFQYMLCSFRKYSSYLYLNSVVCILYKICIYMDRLLYLNDVYLGVGEILLLLDNENLYQ